LIKNCRRIFFLMRYRIRDFLRQQSYLRNSMSGMTVNLDGEL
jgi:hypothetical protein